MKVIMSIIAAAAVFAATSSVQASTAQEFFEKQQLYGENTASDIFIEQQLFGENRDTRS